MATIYSNSTIVTQGLIFCIDSGNTKCFQSGETSCKNIVTGNLVTGASGTPSTGTHTPNSSNFPSYNAINGGVFDFAGGKGMNIEEDLGSHTEFSIEFWYYKSGSGTAEYLSDGRNDGGQWFLTNYSGFNITHTNASTYNFDTAYNGSNTDFINRWQHLILTSDGSGSKMYIDNIERTLLSANSVNENLGKNYRIGTRYTTSGQWTGYMGPVRIYNRVLSPAEVNQNFQAVRGRYGL